MRGANVLKTWVLLMAGAFRAGRRSGTSGLAGRLASSSDEVERSKRTPMSMVSRSSEIRSLA